MGLNVILQDKDTYTQRCVKDKEWNANKLPDQSACCSHTSHFIYEMHCQGHLMASVFTIQHHKTKITTAQSTELNILFRFDPKTTNQHQCFAPLTGFQKWEFKDALHGSSANMMKIGDLLTDRCLTSDQNKWSLIAWRRWICLTGLVENYSNPIWHGKHLTMELIIQKFRLATSSIKLPVGCPDWI